MEAHAEIKDTGSLRAKGRQDAASVCPATGHGRRLMASPSASAQGVAERGLSATASGQPVSGGRR